MREDVRERESCARPGWEVKSGGYFQSGEASRQEGLRSQLVERELERERERERERECGQHDERQPRPPVVVRS